MNDQLIQKAHARKKSATSVRTRMVVLKTCFIAFFALVMLRLVQIQIIDSAIYKEIAKKQYQARVKLPSMRGMILDRNGSVIASNSKYVSFAADPQVAIDDADTIAEVFSKVFGKPKKVYLEKLASDSRFVWLERQVSVDYLKKLSVRHLPGVVVSYEPKRMYPYDILAGQVVGFTDIDNNGISGTELQFDTELRGTEGYVVFQRDGKGRARPVIDYPRVEPQNGHNVYLTIDLRIQSMLEEELRKGIELNKAESGIGIVMDPRTGAILAMAQNPSINPNEFSLAEMKFQKLRAVTDMFEPGSVFKLVTTSAAIEDHLISPDQMFFAENGNYRVALGNGKTRDIKDTHPYGWVSFSGALAVSSNIVMAKASDIIGPERLYRMARNYGFGIQTNIELPGEIKGNLKKPIDWSSTTLNTMAYGYEVGVTPIQIIQAYAAIANNGVLVKPYILEKETDQDGNLVKFAQPQVIRRVVSEATAQTIKSFLIGVVDSGTAKNIKMANMKVAGKTGTSKKFVDGHYEQGSYTGSFVGFYPADAPKLVCLVMMDNPKAGSYYGGAVSGPIFKAVAQRIITTTEYFSNEQNHPAIAQAPMPTPTHTHAAETAKSYAAAPDPDLVEDPSVQTDSTVLAKLPTVPNVTGMTVRKAVNVLTAGKFEPVVTGSGVVVGQEPLAGTPAVAGMKVVLQCQPKSLTMQ